MPPEIDYKKCTACGICAIVCAEGVLFDPGEAVEQDQEKKPRVTCPETCVHCYLCAQACPEGAISIGTPALYQ
jgi:ferredoxin